MPDNDDNAQEKTEPASPRRRQEAREQGRVPTSTEVNSITLLLIGMLYLSLFGHVMYRQIQQLVIQIFSELAPVPLTIAQTAAAARDIGWQLLRALSPFFATLCAAAIIVNILQHGFILSAQPLMPKFNMAGLNPAKGLKELWSLKTLMSFVFIVLKLIVVVRACALTVRQALPEIMSLSDMSVAVISGFWLDVCFRLLARLFVYLLIIALLDYAYQRWEFEKGLRMSKEELKDETRRMEGDPKIKSRIRSIQQQLARKRMMQAVPEADVVITNPTHFAVAVKYDITEMPAPRVVAKGARLLAQRIKDMAREHRIPVIENVELARALYRQVEVGAYVPAQLYQSVAEVLAYVYQINRQRYSAAFARAGSRHEQ